MEAISAYFNLTTMLSVNMLTSALSLLLFLVMARSEHNGEVKISLRRWTESYLLLTLGFGLLQIPAYDFPLPHLIAVANLMIDAGVALGLVAANRLLNRPARSNWLLALPVLLAVIQVWHALVRSVDYDELLMLLGCVSRMSMALAVAWILWRHASAVQRPPARLAAVFHGIWAALLALRIIVLLVGGGDQTALEVSSSVGLTGRFMLTWMIAICLLWILARHLDDQLLQQASRDPLTDLLNRRSIWEAGQGRGNRPMELIMLDIDHFKSINDRWGHCVGDQMLTLVARTISAAVREGDMVARVGGEEFMVLPAAGANTRTSDIAERIRAAVAKAGLALEDGSVLQCTVSIGHARASGGDGRWERLVAEADAALYAAKHGGRNQVVAYATPALPPLTSEVR